MKTINPKHDAYERIEFEFIPMIYRDHTPGVSLQILDTHDHVRDVTLVESDMRELIESLELAIEMLRNYKPDYVQY